ncbi:MAG: hypothetical protein M1838_002183 [Thelocarpon superellum]|nr:MAG: hypothetical protein M1838_002183 [Thelocarpon superellum]
MSRASTPGLTLESLPNELLIQILGRLPTRTLLPVTAVSSRFHDVIVRILQHRLLLAASLEDQRLMLECYHPSAKSTSPPMYCDYLGTDGLSETTEGEGSLYEDMRRTGRLGKLAGTYSHFRPLKPETGRRYRPHPAGSPPDPPGGTSTGPSTSVSSTSNWLKPCVSHSVSLDADEPFSQLCTAAHLVRDGPRGGIFRSLITVSEGTVRIWRRWLASQAADTAPGLDDSSATNGATEGGMSSGPILWIDEKQRSGIRVRVKEDAWRRPQPILIRDGEDLAVSYTVDLEELLIRTTHLLIMVEESLQAQHHHSGQAVVFGSFG